MADRYGAAPPEERARAKQGGGAGAALGLVLRAGGYLGLAGAWAGRAALDALIPPVSPLSGAPGEAPGRLEAELWARLQFLDAPWCDRCGLPFPYDPFPEIPGSDDSGPGALCGACIARTPAYDRARSALAYDEASRPLVLAFKHGGRRDALGQFAAWMTRAAHGAQADVIVPVPLHYLRLVRRRYNQSSLLGRALSRRMELPFDAGLLVRRKRTESQAGKSAQGRRRNLAGAFFVPHAARPRLSGARVLVVDDVMTTGATLESCARTLKRAGAARVEAVTLARVPRPSHIPL